MSDHTRPELAAEFRICRKLRAAMIREGKVCNHCIHRDPASLFGRHPCKQAGRSFPLCMHTPGLQFDPDHETLRGN